MHDIYGFTSIMTLCVPTCCYHGNDNLMITGVGGISRHPSMAGFSHLHWFLLNKDMPLGDPRLLAASCMKTRKVYPQGEC